MTLGLGIMRRGGVTGRNAKFESVKNGFCPKRGAFQFSPIDLKWRGHKVDLTLGHQYKNYEMNILSILLFVTITESFKVIGQSVYNDEH